MVKFSPSPKARDSGADGAGPGLSPGATRPDGPGQEEAAVRLTSTRERTGLVPRRPPRDQRRPRSRGPLDSASWPSAEPSQRRPHRRARPPGTLTLLKCTRRWLRGAGHAPTLTPGSARPGADLRPPRCQSATRCCSQAPRAPVPRATSPDAGRDGSAPESLPTHAFVVSRRLHPTRCD